RREAHRAAHARSFEGGIDFAPGSGVHDLDLHPHRARAAGSSSLSVNSFWAAEAGFLCCRLGAKATSSRPPHSSQFSSPPARPAVPCSRPLASPPAGSSRVKEWPLASFTAFIFQRQFGIEVCEPDGDEPRVVRRLTAYRNHVSSLAISE